MDKKIFSFGISSAHLHFTHIDEAVKKAVDLGFQIIEFFSPETDARMNKYSASYLRDLCVLNGVIPGYHAPYMNEYDMGLNSFDKISEKMRIIARTILGLQPAYIVIHMGTFSQERDEGLLQFTKALNEALLPSLDGWQGAIGIENFTLCHGPKALGDRIEDFRFVFGRVGMPNVGLTLDFGHANITRNLFIYIEQFGNRLVSTHIADNGGTDDEHSCVGDGTVDWTEALREISLKGFRGPHIIECANPEVALMRVREILSSIQQVG